jgi:hypothetical protein
MCCAILSPPYYTRHVLFPPTLGLLDELLGYSLEYTSEYRHETALKLKPESFLPVYEGVRRHQCTPRCLVMIVVGAFVQDNEMYLPKVKTYLERSKGRTPPCILLDRRYGRRQSMRRQSQVYTRAYWRGRRKHETLGIFASFPYNR